MDDDFDYCILFLIQLLLFLMQLNAALVKVVQTFINILFPIFKFNYSNNLG